MPLLGIQIRAVNLLSHKHHQVSDLSNIRLQDNVYLKAIFCHAYQFNIFLADGPGFSAFFLKFIGSIITS